MIFKGKYIRGEGIAHKYTAFHDKTFHCRMVGTFNVECDGDIRDCPPTIELDNGHRYWLLKLRKGDESAYAWASHWKGSERPRRIWELISKAPLSEVFRQDGFALEYLERWPLEKIQEWAAGQYWYQTFPWSLEQKADSACVWDAINAIDWSGLSVLDIGGNAGFHCFEASKRGAQAICFEPSDATRLQGQTINDHIEMQDVQFVGDNPSGTFDVVLYLSVHHQRDSRYEWLANQIADLRARAHKYLFVELHVEACAGDFPVDPVMSEAEIERILGGITLLRYKHRLRGTRRIFCISPVA